MSVTGRAEAGLLAGRLVAWEGEAEQCFMSELQRVHCRFCNQTFLTTVTEAQRCDACGKVGGLIDPEVALAEECRKALQREEEAEARQRKKPFTLRRCLQGICGLLVLNGTLITLRERPGELAWLFGWATNVVGCLGYFVIWLWPQKRKAPEGAGKADGVSEGRP